MMTALWSVLGLAAVCLLGGCAAVLACSRGRHATEAEIDAYLKPYPIHDEAMAAQRFVLEQEPEQLFVESYDGILGSHDLIVHNYGPTKSLASIHAEVPNNVDIETSHEIIDRIERDAAKKLGIFLVIHMDPVETADAQVAEVKAEVQEVLHQMDERLSLHDFRMVDGEKWINLIFDVVVPFSYGENDRPKLREAIEEKVRSLDERYHCVITFDSGFVAEE